MKPEINGEEAAPTLSTLDKEIVQLILAGASVVDWRSLPISDRADAEHLLRVNRIQPEREEDAKQLSWLVGRSVRYLEAIHGRPVPIEIKEADVIQLMLWASGSVRADRMQTHACCTLKVMHLLHNLMARRLLFTVPFGETELFQRVTQRLEETERALRRRGLLHELTVDRKSTDSMLSKLLTTKKTHAAQVFDRLRCRFVVPQKSDLPEVLAWMGRNTFPFNYVLPLQTKNAILTVEPGSIFDWTDAPRQRFNEMSGSTFRSLLFVVEIPLRVDELLAELSPRPARELGSIVFAEVEIQLLDRETHAQNCRGDNAHEAYKSRQMRNVHRRLGLLEE